MINDGLGDWRIQGVTTLAADVPASFPGGPSHKKGTPVYLASMAMDAAERPIAFTTPSPMALGLSIARDAAHEATRLRKTIALQECLTPSGSGQKVANENIPHLFDCFQHSMIAVTFSFQALETFCNEVIANKLKGTYTLKRKKKMIDLDGEKLQRFASTDDKLGEILPRILGLKSPKGSAPWDQFLKLKDARDSTIHLKKPTPDPRGRIAPSLFHQFFQDGVEKYPRDAADIIGYFIPSTERPRWFATFEERLTRP